MRVLLLLLAACGTPARLEEPRAAAAPWCFALLVEAADGGAHYARACADAAPLCAFARDRAIALAELGHFMMVGGCRSEVR